MAGRPEKYNQTSYYDWCCMRWFFPKMPIVQLARRVGVCEATGIRYQRRYEEERRDGRTTPVFC